MYDIVPGGKLTTSLIFGYQAEWQYGSEIGHADGTKRCDHRPGTFYIK